MRNILIFFLMTMILLGMTAQADWYNYGDIRGGNGYFSGDVTIAGNLATTGTNIANNIISENLQILGGKGIKAEAGAGYLDIGLMTSGFKGPTGNVYLNNTHIAANKYIRGGGAATFNSVSSNGTIVGGSSLAIKTSAKVSGKASVDLLQVNNTEIVGGNVYIAGSGVTTTLQRAGSLNSNTTLKVGTIATVNELRLNNSIYMAGNIQQGGSSRITGTAVAGNIIDNTTLKVGTIATVNELRLNNSAYVYGNIIQTGSDRVTGTGIFGNLYDNGTLKAGGAATVNSLASNNSIVAGTTLETIGTAKIGNAATVNSLASNGTIVGGSSLALQTTAKVGTGLTANTIASNGTIVGGSSLALQTTAKVGTVATVNELRNNNSEYLAGNIYQGGSSRVTGTVIAGNLKDNGTLDVTGATRLAGTTINASSTLAVTSADSLTVAGVIVPQVIPITFQYDASSVDQQIFSTNAGYQITGARLIPRVVGGDAGAVNVQVRVCDDGEAPSAGDAALTGALDLKGTADTVQVGALSANVAVASGKSIAVDFTGTMTAAIGTVTVYVKRVP